MKYTAIRAENLSKEYKIAASKYRHDTLRDQIMEGLKTAIRRSGQAHRAVNSFWALKDVSFEIKEGESIGIIGHNGAGKSTLLKILSRITEPTRGKAEIFGRVGSLLEVGTGFHPELSGRENIYLNAAIIGMKRDEIRRRFDEIVEFAEIGKFLDMPVKRYSSGMYVRLAFAVAAHLEPEILLIDEVLAVGDANFQKKCLGKMGDVTRAGRSVIFVSHNMIAVNSLCERVIWMDGGQMADDGPATQVVTRYLSASLNDKDSTEEVWNDVELAPGNDTVRLHRVAVRCQDGNTSDPLTMQTPFQVEVEYWSLSAGSNLNITLHLYTGEGLVAFTTGTGNYGPMPSGLYRSVCHVPGDLLNSGLHRFRVLVVKDTSSVILNYECRMTFNILDVRQREGACFGREPGVVQPVLNWTTECLDGDSEEHAGNDRCGYNSPFP